MTRPKLDDDVAEALAEARKEMPSVRWDAKGRAVTGKLDRVDMRIVVERRPTGWLWIGGKNEQTIESTEQDTVTEVLSMFVEKMDYLVESISRFRNLLSMPEAIAASRGKELFPGFDWDWDEGKFGAKRERPGVKDVFSAVRMEHGWRAELAIGSPFSISLKETGNDPVDLVVSLARQVEAERRSRERFFASTVDAKALETTA